jgi:Tol biopolymer transport system component
MPLSAGDRLGPYEILAPIGAGAMGEVYRARDARLRREVALKILPAEVAGDSARRQRFEQEARAVAALNHPNIVAIYDVGEKDGVLFLVTELVEGRNLQGPLPLEAALKAAAQIADALQAAHDKGIVHRDLKPANIMLRADGSVKLLDFGLAKALREPSAGEDASMLPTETLGATQAGMVVGTAAYMSPEQAQGLYVDKRADIWAFGVVLYELVTGKRPFRGSTLAQILASVLKDEPDWDPVPAQMRRLLRRCLVKDPARRLRDIGDAMDLVGEEASGKVAPKPSRWLPAALAALALAALAIAGEEWLSRAPEPETWAGSILSGAEFALDPRISPDGQVLAFQVMEQNQTQVAVMTPESGNWSVRTRNRELGLPFELAWSRDGTSIYYDRSTDVPRGIYIVPFLGGDEKLVLENAMSPEVLPDGSLLVYRLNAQRNLQLFRYWPETGRLHDLPIICRPEGGIGTPSVHIRASPDGKEAVIVGTPLGREKEPDRLLAVDVNTGASRPLTPAGIMLAPGNAAAVARDGKTVVMVLARGALKQVVSISMQGPMRGPAPAEFAPRTLFTATSDIWYLDTGAGGKIYLSTTDGPGDVFRFSPATHQAEVIGAVTSQSDDAVISLPDGRTIVSIRGLGRDRLMAIADGKNPVPLAATTEETAPPMTAVGQRGIAFTIGPPPHTTIALAETDTGRITSRIDPGKGEIVALASSPDGKTLYFSAGGEIWSVPSAGGEPRPIRAGDSMAADPGGRSLVISTIESAKVRLFRVPLDGAKEREIVTDGSVPLSAATVNPGGLSADGRLLWPLAPVDSWFTVPGIIDINTGRITRIRADPIRDASVVTWTADGRLVGIDRRPLSALWQFEPAGRNSRN